MFNDTLPKSIGQLSNLKTLWISSNLIKGVITEALMSNLSHLQGLDLSLNSNLSIKFDPHWVPPFQLRTLSLRGIKLGPEFPLWLKTQTELAYIDISNAGISDAFPNWFTALTLIHMNTSNNQMDGVIPELSFSSNSSSGSQRTRLYWVGITLDLSSNRISGSITFLCKTKEWKFIDLSNNLLFDQIPDCFANFKVLQYLNLVNNHLFGGIPFSFGSLSNLNLLHLRNNSFLGELPASMENCTKLNMIDLGENRFTGEIPSWIGERFSELTALILRSNEFHGKIPSSLCNATNIQILDLSSNKISESIPECVCNYSRMIENDHSNDVGGLAFMWIYFPVGATQSSPITKLSESGYFTWKGKEIKYKNYRDIVKLIDLSNNNLVGEIPAQITKLVGLVGLNLSRNNLTGPIPENIDRLTSLNILDFSRNHLSGGVPTNIDGLNSLGVLDLSYNNLSGRIPESGHALTHDRSSYIGNSDLCGRVLNKSCPGDEPHQTPSIDVSKVQSEDDEIINGEFYLAMGLGFFFGFWGVFGTILLNKEMRYAFFQLLNVVGDLCYVRVELTKARLIRYFQNW